VVRRGDFQRASPSRKKKHKREKFENKRKKENILAGAVLPYVI
jgi:hypothetical protein